MPSFANPVWPVPDRFINLGKEPGPGSLAAGTYTFPMTQFKPQDKYSRYEDTAWRNAMAQLYNLVNGVRIAEVSCGGPFFADGMGYPLLNVLGDYYQFVNGVVGTSSSLSGSVASGAASVVVASATGFSVGEIISVGGTGTTAEEVRRVTNISAGTLTLNSALYQGHASGGTVFAYSSVTNIGHNFTLLNSGTGAGGYLSCQPPTYTYEDFTGVPAVTGARVYTFSCFSEVGITGNAQELVMWDGKFTSLASAIAQSTPVTSLTPVIPQPSWNTTVAIAGAGTANNAEYKLALTRKLAPKFTNQGVQDPYSIPRGYFTAGLSFTFDPISDEAEFIYYLNNVQPTCVITSSNGLSGTNAASLAITSQVVGFTDGEYDDSKDVFGLSEQAKIVASPALAGPSGGFSPVLITLVNGVVNY